MANLQLSIPDHLFAAYERLMQERGKTVEDGCREYLATLLIEDDGVRLDAQARLSMGLPPTPQVTELIAQTYPQESGAGS